MMLPTYQKFVLRSEIPIDNPVRHARCSSHVGDRGGLKTPLRKELLGRQEKVLAAELFVLVTYCPAHRIRSSHAAQ